MYCMTHADTPAFPARLLLADLLLRP